MALGRIAGLQSSNNDLELTLSKNFVWLDKNESTTVTVNTPSDGKIYITSSNPNIIKASINNKIITLIALEYGTAIITVGQDIGTGDYANKTPASKNILVANMDSILENNSWETISKISQEGIGDSYWSVGDVKSITLNGNIGNKLTLSNFETNVFILHFNYPINGVADNNIIWGGFKDSSGVDIALIDYWYGKAVPKGTICFNVNHWGNSNWGGWKGCDLRYDILGATSIQPSDYGTEHTTACVGYDATSATLTNPKANTLLAALPANFRNSLKLWSRWINAIGNNNGNVDANIEETVDAVTLLAEFEVFGARHYANKYEQNHQSQMEYYRLGNSRIKYRHDDSSSSIKWRLASPFYSNNIQFCYVRDSGGYSYSFASSSDTVAPAFKT